MIQVNFQEVYNQDLFNRYYLYKNVNYRLGKTYSLKLMALNMLLIFKLIISRFVKKKKINTNDNFISWSPLHLKRSKDLAEKFETIPFERSSFSMEQLELFANISFNEISKYFFKVKKSDVRVLKNYSFYINDSIFYRFLFIVEFLALKGILNGSEKVLIAGYNDRTSLIISKICEFKKIHLSMLQHGVLGKKEEWKHLKADRFFYLYDFSKEYIAHQIEVNEFTELIYLPKKKSNLKLGTFIKGVYSKNIAYATSPADSSKDIEILTRLIKISEEKKVNLLIYPHPLEKETVYSKFENNKSIFVTRERHKNVEYLISRYSTLGIDYFEKNITPVFLNFDGAKSDFLNANIFNVFKNFEEFDTWIKNNI
ncbi:hypothetical protein [uncultured Aquimarina sp.]|uniref:hypothetical protein n=1 Tax=uncultured Aquimarina sp. TaxID=575652 RepID=UPI002618127C|nr:hypothetical protein [uncultured Aquimarina sp.]